MSAVDETTATADLDDDAPEPAGAPHLTLVLTAEAPLAPSLPLPLAGCDVVEIGRGRERRAVRDDGRLRVAVPDRFLSGDHARLRRVGEGFRLEDRGAKNGCYRAGVRVRDAVLSDGDVLELGHTFFVFRAREAPARGADGDAPLGMASLSPGLAALFARLAGVARATLPILVTGESGTGKELVARAVHALSGRPGPLVPVNCGALPATLVEAEFFGFRKGAFSGAAEDRPGLVRASDRGTLFLDEVGELPPPAQAALLRVLQEREVRPIGAVRSVPVDLRVVAATHRDLAAAVKRGEFRADLLARLSGFAVRLPSLAERREDLGLIVAALLARLAAGRSDLRLSHAAARDLFYRRWSGNVRELEHWLAAALPFAADGTIGRAEQKRRGDQGEPALAGDDEAARRAELAALLVQHRGNVTAVARALGRAREQVYRWIKRYGLDPGAYRTA